MKYRLDTPYREKDEAKALGARWDPFGKYWYYETDGTIPAVFMRWDPMPVGKADADKEAEADKETEADSTAGSVTAALADASVTEDKEFDAYKTVSEVNSLIRNCLLSSPALQHILVKGEITNYSGHRKGQHFYFSIKDTAGELLNCFMLESVGDQLIAGGLEMKNGVQVAITGNIDHYGKAAKMSLRVRRMVGIGAGAMNLALLKLKEKLEAEGLFDEEHKKPIPRYPRNVGIVTSMSGMAIKDIMKVAGKRDPYVQLILYHVSVQGKDAVPEIVKGIESLDRMGLDTIIVGRGGGSDEELMSYNSESIARAVYAALTPVISAVGHEGHWTLIDLVADKRVATPSEAAEEAVPDVMRDVRRVREQERLLTVNMKHCIERRKAYLKAVCATLEKNSPESVLNNRMNRLTAAGELLSRTMQQLFEEKKRRYEELAEGMKAQMNEIYTSRARRLELTTVRLHGLSPTARLVRGFGYISHDGRPVSGVEDIRKDDEVQITVHDGTINTRVTGVEKSRNTE